MTFYKRHSCYWCRYMADGVEHRISTHAKTLKGAKEFVEKMRVVARSGSRAAALKMVDILFPPERGVGIAPADAWAEYVRVAKLTGMDGQQERTLASRRQRVERFVEWLAAKCPALDRMEDVDGPVAGAYAAHLAQMVCEKGKTKGRPLSVKTRANIIAELSTVFTMLQKSSSEMKNPWDGLIPRGGEEGRTNVFTEEQEEAVMRAAAEIGKDWPLACVLGRDTGQRYGSIATLKWEKVDMEARVIHFKPRKTQRYGILVDIPMTAEVYEALAAREPKEGPVLPLHDLLYGNPSQSAYDRLNFREVLNAAGIGQGWTFHSWRHTARTRLDEAGVDMETSKRMLGHTRDETSRRYSHASHVEEDRQALARAFGEMA